MRLTLDDDVALDIAHALNLVYKDENFKKVFRWKNDNGEFVKNFKYLADEILKEYHKPIKTTKRNATKNATLAKIETTKKKLESTINLMRLEGKKISVYSVAKESGVSYNTAKKYDYLLEF